VLWLHVGTQKTGSTTLQSFLNRNEAALGRRGLHYLRTGRAFDRKRGVHAYSHNKLAVQMRKGWPESARLARAFAEETATWSDATQVISCEALFGTDLAALRRHLLGAYRGRVSVLVYLRRWDLYLEAQYKQALKLGLADPCRRRAGAAILARALAAPGPLNYAAELDRIATALPGARIVVRPYQPRSLAEGDIVADALCAFGIADRTGLEHAAPSNRSFSHAAARALGDIARRAGHDRPTQRRLFRVLYRYEEPALYGHGDVFSAEERTRLLAAMRRVNAGLGAWTGSADDPFDPPADIPPPDPLAEARAAALVARVWDAFDAAPGA
jgi:hypothetical protein